jgi:hypothetical protein
VILRSYFDGGNQADSTLYDVVTLAALSGTKEQWEPIETAWRMVLARYNVGWLHTTDAVALNDPYSRNNGWDASKRDRFINECFSAADPFFVRRIRGKRPYRHGVYPCTVSVLLKDHKRARSERDGVPKDANEICAVDATYRCLEWGEDIMGADFFHFTFDQGEPFRGHAEDRRRNKNARKEFPSLGRISSIKEGDMRSCLPLQLADLFAWSVSHKKKKPYFSWQRRVLAVHRMDDWLEYRHLINPVKRAVDLVEQWRLPRRKPNR